MSLVTEEQGYFGGFALCLYYNADSGHVKAGCLCSPVFRLRLIILPDALQRKSQSVNGSSPSLGGGQSIFFMMSTIARCSILRRLSSEGKAVFASVAFRQLAVPPYGIGCVNQAPDSFRIFKIGCQVCPVVFPGLCGFGVFCAPFPFKPVQLREGGFFCWSCINMF